MLLSVLHVSQSLRFSCILYVTAPEALMVNQGISSCAILLKIIISILANFHSTLSLPLIKIRMQDLIDQRTDTQTNYCMRTVHRAPRHKYVSTHGGHMTEIFKAKSGTIVV